MYSEASGAENPFLAAILEYTIECMEAENKVYACMLVLATWICYLCDTNHTIIFYSLCDCAVANFSNTSWMDWIQMLKSMNSSGITSSIAHVRQLFDRDSHFFTQKFLWSYARDYTPSLSPAKTSTRTHAHSLFIPRQNTHTHTHTYTRTCFLHSNAPLRQVSCRASPSCKGSSTLARSLR